MPYNGSGTFTPPSSDFPAVTNTVISSTKFNNVINDLATGLTTALTKDGQTTPTANLTMGGYKLTNVGAATAVADAVRLDQVRKGVGMTLASVTGIDTITATGSPTIAALAAGMMLFLTPANTNTGAATLNPDGLGAKNLYYANAAMSGGEIRQNIPSLHYYDGTQFQLIGPFVGGTVPGNTTFSGTLTVAGAFAANGGVTLGNAAGDALTIASSAWTLSNAVTITGTWANLGTVTTIDINGGTLDGVVIGGASAAAATVTTLTASGLTTLTTQAGTGYAVKIVGRATTNDGSIGFYQSDGITSAGQVAFTASGIDLYSPNAAKVAALSSTGLAVTGLVGASGQIYSTGPNTTHGASRILMEQESAAASIITAYGTDTLTNGTLTIRSRRSDGSNSIAVGYFSSTGLAVTGALSATGQFNLPSYTVAGAPSAATAGGLIYVSNEVGGAVVAFSDGTNWRRVTDRAVIS